MNQVNVDSDQVLRLATALKVYADRTSEIMSTMHRTYTHLDDEWDDESKHEFIDSLRKTCVVLSNVSDALSNTTSDLNELALIIEQYANI